MTTPNHYRLTHTFQMPAAGFANGWLHALACCSKNGSTTSSCVLLELGNEGGAAIATSDDILFVAPLSDQIPDPNAEPVWSGYIPDPDGIVTKLARSLARTDLYVTIEISEHKKDPTASGQLSIRATSGESISTHIAMVEPTIWRQAFRQVNEHPVAAAPDFAQYEMSAIFKLAKIKSTQTLLIQPADGLAAFRLTNDDGVRIGQGVMFAKTSKKINASFEGQTVDFLADITAYLQAVAPAQQQLDIDGEPVDYPGGINPDNGEALDLDALLAENALIAEIPDEDTFLDGM